MNIITLKINKQKKSFLIVFLILQIYHLLPEKNDFRAIYGGFMNEADKNCINAEDITYNGIIYTPRQITDDDDVYSIFEVVLPENITQTDF